MLTLINSVRNWVAYRNTVAELSALPLDTLLDIDIYYGDIEKIARAAVYGREPYATPAYMPKLRFITNPIHA